MINSNQKEVSQKDPKASQKSADKTNKPADKKTVKKPAKY